MTHRMFVTSGILATAIAVVCTPAFIFAAEFRTGEQVSLKPGESTAKNAYLAGGSVISSAAIPGDLSAAGGTIVVQGVVGGDVLAAGGNVSALGDIKDDARIAGGTIVVSGAIGNDISVAGGQITITSSKIGGDALLAGGTIELSAPVGGSVRISGGAVTIDAPIAGNVEVHAQSLTLGSKAVIAGNLTYEAPKAAVMHEGAHVKGKTAYTPIVNVSEGPAAAVALFSIWVIAKLASLVVCALIMFVVFKRYVSLLARDVAAQPARFAWRGFVSLVVIPAAAFVMFLTVVGVPLGVVAIGGYVVLLVFSWILAPIAAWALVEKWWFKRTPSLTWQHVIYGALIYVLVGLIPLVGGLIKFVVMLMALGAIIEKKREIATEWM